MLSQHPKFSICIPTYNRAHLLPKALESALNQTFSDFEIIVSDNASSDHTQTILKKYDDPRISCVFNERTVSMYANHNICTKNANTPWVVFLHSDDVLEIDCLEVLNELVGKSDAVCIRQSKVRDKYKNSWHSYELNGSKSVATLLRWKDGCPSGAAYKKHVLAQFPFKEDTIAADYDMLFKILLADYSIHYIQRRLCVIEKGDFQSSAQWVRSGRYSLDLARVLQAYLYNQKMLAGFHGSVKSWEPSEIASVFKLLAFIGDLNLIQSYEAGINPSIRYKTQSGYLAVRIVRLIGSRGLKWIYYCFCFIKHHSLLRRSTKKSPLVE